MPKFIPILEMVSVACPITLLYELPDERIGVMDVV